MLPDSIVRLVRHVEMTRYDLATVEAWLQSHDPHMRDRDGKTLYFLAHKSNLLIPLVQLLMKHGYDPNHTPWIGAGSGNWRPLHYAANRDDLRHIRFLLSRGAALDAAHGDGFSAEQMISYRPRDDAYILLRDVRLAGGWKRYVNEPRKDLLVLRELCSRGRATPPPSVLAALLGAGFDSARPRTRRNPRVTPLPTPIFWHVLSYWRSDRDSDLSAA